jgi:hypothetical protein
MGDAHRPETAPAPARSGRNTIGARGAALTAQPARGLAVLWALVRAEPVLVGLLVFAGLFFLYRWGIDFRRPWGDEHQGWRGYVDQRFYLLEAQTLARFEPIPKEYFFYGPGYPALAAPFAWIGPHGGPFEDPFLPANAFVWLLTVAATYLAARRLLGEWAGVAAALALVLATPLVRFVTLPWNSTVSLGAVAATVLVALRPRVGPGAAAVLGAAIGFAYAARYVDAVWLGIIAAAILLARLPAESRSVRLRVLGGLTAGALIPLVPTFYLHARAFGSPFTATYSYHRNVGPDDFDVANIPWHALQAFVSPYYFSDEPTTKAQPLLHSAFLIVLAPIGAWFLLRESSGARRIILAGYTVASLAATVFYCAYYFTGSKSLVYGSLHFFKMWLPIWSVAAVVGAVGLVSRGRAAAVPSERGTATE